MSKEDRAVVIVELIAQAMAGLTSAERGEQAVCHGLARATAADAAVLVGLDPARGLRVHAAWPNPRTAAVLGEAIASAPGHRLSEHPVLGEVIVLGPPLNGEPHPNTRARAVVLSRRTRFTPEARTLLTEAMPALLLLLPRVGETCEVAERAKAAADAVAELNLTTREVEVLQLLSEGLLARTIATRLGLSPRTVHKHLSNVYTKLGVHDRLVAVSIARERGLISS